MPKKLICNHGLGTDGWVSLDAADLGLIEGVYKKNLREGEERLMLAVLESAVEDFQKYVLARNPSGRKLFREAEEWFLDKDSDALLSLGVSAKPSGCILTTYGRACRSGRKRGSKRLRLRFIVKVAQSYPERGLSTFQPDFPRRHRFFLPCRNCNPSLHSEL
jgi:hypothetical protein